MKMCSKCQTAKSADEFHKNKSRKDGLMGICKSCNSERMRAWYAENPDKRKRHGLTQEEYDGILEGQANACASCGNTEGPFRIDHDHNCCDKRYGCKLCVRGVLCNGCNVALAMVGDSVVRLEKLVQYLGRFA